MGDSAHDFPGMIIDSAGVSASDRIAFKAHAEFEFELCCCLVQS